MSNTFHKPQYRKPQLIDRRIQRKMEPVFEEKIEPIEKIHPKVKKLIEKVLKESTLWDDFVGRCGNLLEETWSYGADVGSSEEDCHPIFSQYTQRKVEELLRHNPDLTNTYFETPQDDILRLENTPLQPKPELTKEQQYRIVMQLWGLLYTLLPPPEYIYVLRYVQQYCSNIQREIERNKLKVQVAVGVPLEGRDNTDNT